MRNIDIQGWVTIAWISTGKQYIVPLRLQGLGCLRVEYMESVIMVDNLVKHFGTVRAVDGVSFEVKRGEVFGVLGPNGAGKTTTLEIIEGLQKPTAGRTLVLGIDTQRDYYRRSRRGTRRRLKSFYCESWDGRAAEPGTGQKRARGAG